MRRTEDGGRTLRGATSWRRLGRRDVRRHNGWFEAVNRNNILSRPELECKVSGGAGDNLKRAGIARGKGRGSGITPDKNMRGCLKRGGNGERGWRREEIWWCAGEEGKKWEGEKKVVGRGEET